MQDRNGEHRAQEDGADDDRERMARDRRGVRAEARVGGHDLGTRLRRHHTIVTAAIVMPAAPLSIRTFAPGQSAPAASASDIWSVKLNVLVLPNRSTVLQ